jgi:hypothetical protein
MPTVADLVRPGTALPGIADRMQIRGFCARWHPIVIAACARVHVADCCA